MKNFEIKFNFPSVLMHLIQPIKMEMNQVDEFLTNIIDDERQPEDIW